MPTTTVYNIIGWEFQNLLDQCGIHDSPLTSRNRQSNGVCEQMHQTVGIILRTLLHGDKVKAQTAPKIIDNALRGAAIMNTTRAAKFSFFERPFPWRVGVSQTHVPVHSAKCRFGRFTTTPVKS